MATPSAQAAKERKQKIFVVVGGLLLLGILAIQVPKLLGGSETSAAGTTETTTTVAGETTPSTPGVATPTAVALVDTDRRPAPGPGQLRSFSVFTKKDPFVQQIVSPPPSEGSASGSAGTTGAGTTGAGTKTPEKTPSKGFSVGEREVAAVTVISVNGARQTLVPGTAFPAADPVFVLVAEQPETKSVVIGIAGGAYASGAATTKLKVGKPLVLENTTTGARYRLVLVAVGNGTATAAGPTGPTGTTAPDGGSTTP